MERWKYFAITHQDHVICNPLSGSKLDEMLEVLALRPGARVLDIASGKAEVLVRLAETYGISGVGVDLSPFCVRDAAAKARQRSVGDRLRFVEQDGRQFVWGPDPYDLCLCIGASWVFGGHLGTLAALRERTRPGGQILVGEPFWRHDPPDAYLSGMGMTRGDFGTHQENVQAGETLGLRFLYAVVSSQDDWDRYEGLQWQAAERYAEGHTDDPEVAELLARVRGYRDQYLAHGREVLGWALYLFHRD